MASNYPPGVHYMSQVVIDRYLNNKGSTPKITSTQMLILVRLASLMGRESRYRCSIKTIATRCLLTEKTVKRALTGLEKTQILIIERTFGTTSVYSFGSIVIHNLSNQLISECKEPGSNLPTTQVTKSPVDYKPGSNLPTLNEVNVKEIKDLDLSKHLNVRACRKRGATSMADLLKNLRGGLNHEVFN